MVVSIADLRRRLKTLFRFETRSAFFADDVIGIYLCHEITTRLTKKQVLGYYKAMISYIKGTVIYIDLKYLVLEVNGIGYKIYTTTEYLSTSIGTELSFWIHMVVREDAQDLYGFPTREGVNFFELLITISGIGPKSALGILNAASVETIQSAIQSGDTSHLTKVSGIGKKNAEKIVLELKDKIETIEGLKHNNDSDALEALHSLGYSHQEAREALKKLDKSITDTGAKVKAALKILS
jgi:Holliday junction DNA helicase RuvA